MARSGDNAPVGQTCRQIDDVISTIKEIYQADEPMTQGERKSLEQTMEDIRRDNEQLRNWGNQQFDRAEEAEKDRDNYEAKVEDLKDEIKELEKELSQQ